jgi:hypothetical protein
MHPFMQTSTMSVEPEHAGRVLCPGDGIRLLGLMRRPA